jgi:hypothetical protein
MDSLRISVLSMDSFRTPVGLSMDSQRNSMDCPWIVQGILWTVHGLSQEFYGFIEEPMRTFGDT